MHSGWLAQSANHRPTIAQPSLNHHSTITLPSTDAQGMLKGNQSSSVSTVSSMTNQGMLKGCSRDGAPQMGSHQGVINDQSRDAQGMGHLGWEDIKG
jgi:hypothetical protein